MNLMANVFLFRQNVHQVLLGIIQMDVPQQPILAQVDLISTVTNVYHINHATKEEFGMIL